jgi:glyceraldehyde 3-phosphate dehydrogenase
VKVLVDEFGLIKGQMTTIHSYTNSQQILDRAGPKDLREARGGAQNIVPTSTGAARASASRHPEVEGILDGMATACLRLPSRWLRLWAWSRTRPARTRSTPP